LPKERNVGAVTWVSRPAVDVHSASVLFPVQVDIKVPVDDDSGSVLCGLADLGKERSQSQFGLLSA
jgi:hypothetical protein